MSRFSGRAVVLIGLLSIHACTVRDLPHVGRTCAGGQPCGPGTRCDPVQRVCVDDSATADARADVPIADAADDAAPDAPAPSELVCGAAEEVGTSPPANNLIEPALRVDGLQLVARGGAAAYLTDRTATDQPFGDWRVADNLPADLGDPAFFTHEAKEYLISTFGGKPRKLQVCPALTDCQPVTMVDGEDNPLTDDIDGPAVATFNGLPLLIFNMVVLDQPSTDHLYQAQPTMFDFTAWLAIPLQFSRAAGRIEDDPAVSPDGTIVLFGDEDDLWVARRPQVGAPFAPPGRVELGGGAVEEQRLEPYLAAAGGGRLELFFRARAGEAPWRIKRAFCNP